MENLDWPELLWKWVDQNFRKERQFFFALDEKKLTSFAIEQGLHFNSSADCVSSLSVYCSRFVYESFPKMLLKQAVFAPDDRGYSPTICLIAQQILAVEKMIGDQKGGTNKYFLRYRELAGYSTRAESIPFKYEEFEELWLQFARELKTLQGATKDNITFARGAAGQNKYRNYPLSQSLLDEHSLREIYKGIKRIPKRSDENLLRRARSLTGITNRSRRAIERTALRGSIISQIRSFQLPENLDSYSSRKKVSERNADEDSAQIEKFFLYKDSEGLDEDYWVVEYHNPDDQAMSALEAFDLCVKESETPGIFFYTDELVYRPISLSQAALNSKEVSYLLMKSERASLLDVALGPASSDMVQREAAEVPEGLALFLCAAEVLEAFSVRKKSQLPVLRFEGGILLNAVSNTYLAGYPPENVIFKGVNLDSSDQLLVGGDQVSIRTLMSIWAEVREGSYYLEFQGHKQTLNIASTRDHVEATKVAGFPLNGDTLSLRTEPSVEGVPGLFHTTFKPPKDRVALQIQSWLRSRCSEREVLVGIRSWLPAPSSAARVLRSKDIAFESADPRILSRLRTIFAQTQRIPPALFHRLSVK